MRSYMCLIIIIIFSLVACNDEPDNIREPGLDPLVNSINVILPQNESLTFEFDECNFDLFGEQKPANSFGSFTVDSQQWNSRTLHTQLNSNDSKLGIKALFIEKPELPEDEEISFEEIQTILQSDVNNKLNSRFGFEVQLTYGDKSYVSTESNMEFDGSNNPFEYYNFDYDISANPDHDSDCNEERTIQLSGSFEGWLINIFNGTELDSVYVNETGFDILLLNS